MSSHKEGRSWLPVAVLIVVAALVVVVGTASSGSAKSVSRQRQLEAVAARAMKAPAKLLAAGRVLGGFTSQQLPVVMQIATKDVRATVIATALNMSCSLGDQPVVPDGWVKLPFTKAGALKASIQIPPSGPTDSSGVALAGGTDTISGKLNGKKATFSGTWDLHLDFTVPNSADDVCDSGRVGFKAIL